MSSRKSKKPGEGWIGVDLDGTLAEYTEWRGPSHIGAPIKKMVKRIHKWVNKGYEVRILTARVHTDGTTARNLEAFDSRVAIEAWCLTHLGFMLEVTCSKDLSMIELWDDRAIAVEGNTGKKLGGNSRIV